LLPPASDDNGGDRVEQHTCNDNDRELPFLELHNEKDTNCKAFEKGWHEIETEVGHLAVQHISGEGSMEGFPTKVSAALVPLSIIRMMFPIFLFRCQLSDS
jgi:hypothetical protein